MDFKKEEFGLISIKKKILNSEEFKFALISVLIFTLLVFFISPPWRVLNFDEVDYFNASSKGIWVNAFDSTSLGIKSFFSLAFWKLKLIESPQVFVDYNEKFDTFLLRHFHPPLLQYITSYFAFVSKEDFKTAEKLVFLVRWGLGCIFILISFLISGNLFKSNKKKSYQLVKVLFISYSALLLSLYLQYHCLLSIFLILTFYCLFNLLNNPIRRNFLLISLNFSLSIISLETTLFSILISSIIYSVIRIKEKDLILNIFRTVIFYFWLLPFTFSIFLWPGALYKISILKSYGLYLYKIFFIKQEWEGVFDIESFSPILILLLVYFFLFLLGLALAIKSKSFNLKKISSYKLSFVFGSFYFIAMLNFSLFHTYMIPGLFIATLPVLEFLNDGVLNRRLIKVINYALVLYIALGSFQLIKLRSYDEGIFGGFPGKDSLSGIAEISEKNNMNIYADAGNILEFYMPSFSERIKNISLIQKKGNKLNSKFKLFVREDQEYKEIKFDYIKKPSLFLFREYYKDVINNLDYPCNSIEIKGLDGYACIVN